MKVLLTVFVAVFLSSGSAKSEKDRGGGDAVVIDFVRSAKAFAKWWKENESAVKIPLSLKAFEASIDPERVVSTTKPLTVEGKEVDAVYDRSMDLIIINRGRWFDINSNQLKMRTSGHEIFRRAGQALTLDDVYEITSTLDIAESNYYCGECSAIDYFELWRKTFLAAEVPDWSKFRKDDFLYLNKVNKPIMLPPYSANFVSFLYLDNRDLVPYFTFRIVNGQNANGFDYYDLWQRVHPRIPLVEGSPDGKAENILYFDAERSRARFRVTEKGYILRMEKLNKIGEWFDSTYFSIDKVRDYREH